MGFFTMNERVALAREGRLPGVCERSEAACPYLAVTTLEGEEWKK